MEIINDYPLTNPIYSYTHVMSPKNHIFGAVVALALTGCGSSDAGPRPPDAAFYDGPSVSTMTTSTPTAVYQGQSFTISFGVINLGEKSAAIPWRISRGGISVATGVTRTLGNNQWVGVTQTLSENTPGAYTWSIQLDPDNSIDESPNDTYKGTSGEYGEYNNNASFYLPVISLSAAG